MTDTGVEHVSTRPGRCANHPGMAQAALCELCRRPLSISCVVPVRGTLVGPECLSKVLTDPPAAAPPSLPLPNGDLLAMAGFGLVVALSILPWSRFGDASGLLQAWTVHWSLPAVVSATAGLGYALAVWRRPQRPAVEVAVYLSVAAIVALTAILHFDRPPPLSSGSVVPLVAVAGAATAAAGATLKAAAMVRASRAHG